MTLTRFHTFLRLPIRSLHLHEHQSKSLLQSFDVSIQKFLVASTPSSAYSSALVLSVPQYVLKAQVHAGGRGKGHFIESGLKGGVHVTTCADRIQTLASQMLNDHLVTKQTTDKGVLVKQVMIAEALDIAKETYFAIVMDRADGGPVLIASSEGGMDIEAVAEKNPEKILKEVIDIKTGPRREQVERLAREIGLPKEAEDEMLKLYALFIKMDATQVEINPLGLTPEGRVVCFDAKITFDENAAFRQVVFKDVDTSEMDPREVEAEKHGLNYVGMDGNIGCLVNGAGLAMATMDIIKLHGAEPANFLDIGGSATQEQVKNALKIIAKDQKVKAVLVNIFGGIMRCDVIAKGIVDAAREFEGVRMVVRLCGTKVEEGKQILRESGVKVEMADDLDEAAAKIAGLVK